MSGGGWTIAVQANTGDRGSSRVRPPHVVTTLAALSERLGPDAILTGDEDDIAAAVGAARGADVALVVAGYTAREEGEYIPGELTLGQESDGTRRAAIGGDRLSLDLPAAQLALIDAVAATGTPVIVAIVAGSAVLVEGWRDRAAAILQTFYAGMEGGTALANILFGDANPSGRLPFTVARDPADYPFFDRDADTIRYDYWHGYGKFARDGVEPRYRFGHGLSYTRFGQRALHVRATATALEITTTISNLGDRAGDASLLCYVGGPGRIERWPRMLKAFTRVSLQPGEARTVTLAVALDDLRYRDTAAHGWRFEPGDYRITVCGFGDMLETSVRL